MKQYIIGKVVSPEFKINSSNNIRTFCFGVLSGRDCKEFSVPEFFQSRDSKLTTLNPSFSSLSGLSDGDYVIVQVRNFISSKGDSISSWLDKVFVMDEMCVDVLRDCMRGDN